MVDALGSPLPGKYAHGPMHHDGASLDVVAYGSQLHQTAIRQWELPYIIGYKRPF